jgi:3-methylcrotonyl-CoA carboxylase alpha subunit
MRHVFRLGDQVVEAALAGPSNARCLMLGDGTYKVALTQGGFDALEIRVDDAVHSLIIAGDERLFFVHLNGEVYEIQVLDPLEAHGREAEREGALAARAPMPGAVVALPVAVGDAVGAGDVIVIIESMKLEMSLRAERAAVVTHVPFAVGQTFEKDAVLVQLAAARSG